MTHHEPKCETCGTFDADCDCTLRWGDMSQWPMPKPPPYPADDEGLVYAGMGNHESIDEAFTPEGARLVRIQKLKDDLSFDQMAELYLTLTDGIVRERLLRRTAEHKLYEIKQLLD